MAARTLTRADLSDAVYREVSLSRSESAELVDSVLYEISDALVSGETFKLSSFGSFVVRQKGERIGRNPKTGEGCCQVKTNGPQQNRGAREFRPQVDATRQGRWSG